LPSFDRRLTFLGPFLLLPIGKAHADKDDGTRARRAKAQFYRSQLDVRRRFGVPVREGARTGRLWLRRRRQAQRHGRRVRDQKDHQHQHKGVYHVLLPPLRLCPLALLFAARCQVRGKGQAKGPVARITRLIIHFLALEDPHEEMSTRDQVRTASKLLVSLIFLHLFFIVPPFHTDKTHLADHLRPPWTPSPHDAALV